MTAQPPSASRPVLRAIIAMVLTSLCFATSDVFSQVLTHHLPPLEVTFLRWVVFSCLLLAWLRGRIFRAFLTKSLPMQLVRGVLNVSAGLCFITGLKYLNIGDATGIAFCGPFIAMALSAMFLKEHVGLRRWLVAGISLIGVMIIVRPGSSAFQLAAILPLASTTLASIMALLTRRMMDESPDTMLTYSAAVGFVMLGLLMPLVWVQPTAADVPPLLMTGVFSIFANSALIYAYKRAGVSLLAPFNYSQLLFSGVLGLVVVGSVPTTLAIFGMVLIAVSGISNAVLESRSKVG